MYNKEYMKKYYQDNKEKLRLYVKEYYQIHKEKIKTKQRLYTGQNKEKKKQYRKDRYLYYREYNRRWGKTRYRQVRSKLNEILGNKCSNSKCLITGGCVEPRCLQIDHKNNDGKKDRARFVNLNKLYAYYINHPNEAKENLQLLCANCNWIKEFDHHYPDFYS